MLKGSIEFEGKTLGDVEMAIQEAMRRITNGYTSGGDRNEFGRYKFQVSGESERVDEEA